MRMAARRAQYRFAAAIALVLITGLAPAQAQTHASRSAAPTASWATPPYRAFDYAHGRVLSILPAGENGLMDAAELAKLEATGARPPVSEDQLGPYATLLYAAPRLTNASLPSYYNDESFGVRARDIVATIRPNPKIPVVIYYDKHRVPHIYGATGQALAYGAGWAAGHDRLFLMDVPRHYGPGTLSPFPRPSSRAQRTGTAPRLRPGLTT